MRRANGVLKEIRLYFIRSKVLNVVVSDVDLSVSNVPSMLASRVVRMRLNFMRGQYPISNGIAPYSDPDVACRTEAVVPSYPVNDRVAVERCSSFFDSAMISNLQEG